MAHNLTSEQLLTKVVFLVNEKRKTKREIEKLIQVEKALDEELAEWLSDAETLTITNNENNSYITGKRTFTFNGKVNHANHIARLAIEELGRKLDYKDLEGIVHSNIINPWAKTLKIIVTADQINNTGFIDPERRYFTKYPLTSKDGIHFYVTTQWDVRHKTRTGIVDGSFIRLIRVLKEHGIEIHESSPELQN